jgi:heme oxygenase
MVTDMRSSILEKLKQSTHIHHQHASKSMDILHLHLSIEEYGALLQRLWGFYSPLETLIDKRAACPFSLLDYGKRKKVPLLTRDLHALDIFTPSFLPICSKLPELSDLSQVLGCMYVLEGATLGGQVISRHLKKQLAIDQTTGCAYFSSYGAEVGCMWQTFCSVLTSYASTHTLEKQILQSACSTFIAFNTWLDEKEPRGTAQHQETSVHSLSERKYL